eukprot:376316_1
MNILLVYSCILWLTTASYNGYNFDSCPKPQEFNTINDFYAYQKTHNTTEEELMYRVWLTDAHQSIGAKCLDGSVPAFYFRPGWDNGTNKFQIFLEGGGWCAGINENVGGFGNCYSRAKNSPVGSSKTWPQYIIGGQYFSYNAQENPLSYNWNTIYIKYCDGASFSGNNETTVTYNNLTLYFRGWRILNGALSLLRNEYGFTENTVTDLLVSGCSAGGLAAFIHGQYIYDNWINPNLTRYMVMPDAGYFLEWEGPNEFVTGMKWVFENQNVTVAMNKGCMQYYNASNNQWECMFAQNISPFIVLPQPGMFVLESNYDSFQIKFELDTNTSDNIAINEYGQNMSTTLINTVITVLIGYRAAFFDSCSHHCSTSWSYDNITINNVSAKNAAVKWYYNTDTYFPNFWYGNKSYPCSDCGCPDN